MHARTQHVTQAIYWEVAAILWMVVEAILSLGAGYQAHSLALTGFGMDSLIELVSAGILVWRLRIEARGADDHAVDRAEAKAARWAVGLLGLLLLYLIGGALWALITRSTVRPSPLGIAVMIISGLLMVLFARQKQRLGVALQSTALQADAAESWTCAYMAWAGLGGTLGVWALGWTWMDPVAALAIAYWVAREAWEAFEEVRETAGPEPQ
ncbi:MAG: cation transporter [Firmicutes bacterium]|nr:cation transporter [Bacillota bacterium]